MKTFNDLEFKQHSNMLTREAKQAVIFFPNGYGASVVTGKMFYTSEDKPYEMAILFGNEKDYCLTYSSGITDDVLGHLTADDVTNYLKMIQELEAAK